VARTQQERREETVARLLDASIATIIDVGYARASAAVITRRAGLSGGALFRHFETMGDFMAATAYEAMRRQLEAFGKQVAEIPSTQHALEGVLHTMRDITGNDTNVVMYELLVAARTDEKLRGTLQNVLVEYSTRIFDTARALPSAEEYPEGTLAAIVALLTNAFDGAAIVRTVLPQPEIEAGRIPLLMALLSPTETRTDD
jgi:AcrR family transcriptional regulator